MLADDIAAFVARKHTVTFQALAVEWPEHFADGDTDMTLQGESPSICLWVGCSRIGVEAVRSLFRDLRIAFQACHPLEYFRDGMLEAPLPVAEHDKHTERRWWPVQILTEQ